MVNSGRVMEVRGEGVDWVNARGVSLVCLGLWWAKGGHGLGVFV